MNQIKYKTGLFDGLHQDGEVWGSDEQIRVVVTFQGFIDLDIMEKTLHGITYIDPILGCRYVQEGNNSYFIRREDIDNEKLCEVLKTNDKESAIRNFLESKVNVSEVPHLRTCIVRDKESDTLCIRINHVIGDGGGSKEIAYLIANTYKRVSENPSMQFQMGEYKPRSIIGLLEKVKYDKIPNDLSSTPPGNPFEPLRYVKSGFYLPTSQNGNTHPDYSIGEISPEKLDILKNYGKLRGATINDLIATALTRALCKISKFEEDIPFTIQISSDVRSKFPSEIEYPIANLFGVHFPKLLWHEEESFEDTLSIIKDKMEDIRKNSLNLDNALRTEAAMINQIKEMGKNIPYNENEDEVKNDTDKESEEIQEKATHIILSNLGIINENRLNFGELKVKDAYILGTLSNGREFMLCASTFKKRLVLSSGYYHSNMKKEDADRIMDSIINELLSI